MNILVTGAQFGNKGAQSLLFSLVSEIKKKYADAKIYYVPLDDISGYDIDHYKFNFVYDDLAKYDCKELIRGTYRKYKAFVVKRKAKKNKVCGIAYKRPCRARLAMKYFNFHSLPPLNCPHCL